MSAATPPPRPASSSGASSPSPSPSPSSPHHVTNAQHTYSLWPAGINSSGQGTIDWAGGLIDWNDPDYKAAGHFYALVESVSVTCADSKSNPANATSYVYGQNATAFAPSVAVSNESTVTNAAVGAFAAGKAVWGTLVGGAALALGAVLL